MDGLKKDALVTVAASGALNNYSSIVALQNTSKNLREEIGKMKKQQLKLAQKRIDELRQGLAVVKRELNYTKNQQRTIIKNLVKNGNPMSSPELKNMYDYRADLYRIRDVIMNDIQEGVNKILRLQMDVDRNRNNATPVPPRFARAA